MNRTVTCDEKLIQNDNRKRSAHWLSKIEWPKTLQSVKYSSKEIAGESSVSSCVKAEIYCTHLDEMIEKLKQKHPRLVNRLIPYVLQNNARPHAAQMTLTKLLELNILHTHWP